MSATIKRLEVGGFVPGFELPTVRHGVLRVPQPGLVHLQFRRFSGCPVCNVHLRSFARRHDELVAAGVSTVAVFHSTLDELRDTGGDFPIPIASDPGRRVYEQYGVGQSLKALLHPRAWWKGLCGVAQTRQPWRGASSPLGLPAEFLVRADGKLLDLHYGAHADDHWEVDELLARVAKVRVHSLEAAEVAS